MIKILLIQLFIIGICLFVGKTKMTNGDFLSIERPSLAWITFFVLEILFGLLINSK